MCSRYYPFKLSETSLIKFLKLIITWIGSIKYNFYFTFYYCKLKINLKKRISFEKIIHYFFFGRREKKKGKRKGEGSKWGNRGSGLKDSCSINKAFCHLLCSRSSGSGTMRIFLLCPSGFFFSFTTKLYKTSTKITILGGKYIYKLPN